MFSIDRIEGETAILEDDNGSIFHINIDLLPESVNEGDCIIKNGDTYTIDTEETKKRRKLNYDLFSELLNDD